MGILDFVKGELIDVIGWLDDSGDTLVWRFPDQDHQIKMGAKLTVREGQAAVFVNEGQIADVFSPGTVQPDNSEYACDDNLKVLEIRI